MVVYIYMYTSSHAHDNSADEGAHNPYTCIVCKRTKMISMQYDVMYYLLQIIWFYDYQFNQNNKLRAIQPIQHQILYQIQYQILLLRI